MSSGRPAPVGQAILPVVELKNQLDAPLGQLADALGQAPGRPTQRCATARRSGPTGHRAWPSDNAPAEKCPRPLGQVPEPVVLLARLLGVGGLLPGQLDRDKLTNRHLRALGSVVARSRPLGQAHPAKKYLDLPRTTPRQPARAPPALAAHWLAKRDFTPGSTIGSATPPKNHRPPLLGTSPSAMTTGRGTGPSAPGGLRRRNRCLAPGGCTTSPSRHPAVALRPCHGRWQRRPCCAGRAALLRLAQGAGQLEGCNPVAPLFR